MAKGPRQLSKQARVALNKIRAALASLDDVEETTTFGNPTFKVVGMSFAVLDLYEGRDCLWMRVDAMERDDRLTQTGWFASPYDPKHTALCCALNDVDWRRAPSFLRRSYQLAQNTKSARKRGT